MTTAVLEKVTVRPLGARVLLRPKPQEKEVGGIVIPETAKEKPHEGRVLAVGAGRTVEDGRVIPLEVKPGDDVLYGKYAGSEITVDGEDLFIVDDGDLMAIIRPAETAADDDDPYAEQEGD